MEAIAFYAIQASAELAAERGRYRAFDGSLWSRGILPIDSLELLARSARQASSTSTAAARSTGTPLRAARAQRRHAQLQRLAIAPTATISNIFGVRQSIEPTFQNLYVKSNLSGEFTVTTRTRRRPQGARACGTR